MPSYGHHHQHQHQHRRRSSSYGPQNASLSRFGGAVTTGTTQAAQSPGDIGSLSNSLRMANLGPSSNNDLDGLFLPATRGGPAGAYNASAANRRNSDLIGFSNRNTPAMSNQAQSFDSSRRAAAFGRQPEELHIPTNPPISSMSRQQSTHDYPVSSDVGGVPCVPSINVHPSNTQAGQYGSGSSSAHTLPGALQPGHASRPSVVSTSTAPSILPTLPQLSTQFGTQSTGNRPAPNLHGHSKSSPSGPEQPGYRLHGTSEGYKYAPTSGPGFQPYLPQGPKYSPLGLADIRPSGDLLPDATTRSPETQHSNDDKQTPTNSNYIAPWPIYAVDWCKWPMHGSTGASAGKIAVGSYLEDSHNYVRFLPFTFRHFV